MNYQIIAYIDGKEKFIGGEPEIFGKVSVMK